MMTNINDKITQPISCPSTSKQSGALKSLASWALIAAMVLLSGLSQSVFALDAKDKKLIAYPNPFRTSNQVLTIQEKSASGPKNFSGKVKAVFFNINGVQIYSRTYSNRVRWSGFDSQGNRVAPGVYHVKLIFKDADGGVNTQWITIAIK